MCVVSLDICEVNLSKTCFIDYNGMWEARYIVLEVYV